MADELQIVHRYWLKSTNITTIELKGDVVDEAVRAVNSLDANEKRIAELREALLQCRTLLSTLKHRNEADQDSLDAAIDLTADKVAAALEEKP